MMESSQAQHGNEKETLKSIITYLACKVPHLQEVKLIKLIYIAQLYHYSNYGELLTRTRFFSFSYGPHAPTIRSTIEEQLKKSAIHLSESRTSTDPIYSNPCLIIRSREHTDSQMPFPFLNTLREVVEDWGDKSFADILDYTSRTIPFLSTTYKEHIDLTRIQPLGDLRRTLSLPQRIQIHTFVDEPGEALGQDNTCGDSFPVSVGEVAEIYLALCGGVPEELPSREYLGFNSQAVLNAVGTLIDKDEEGMENHLTEIDKATHLTYSLLDSMSFRSYSGRVALKAGMLFLKRSGYSFGRDVLEESWPQGTGYKTLREWFDRISVKADAN